MKHYWINLDKNKLRNHFMMSQFEKMRFENYRISAVTPDDFDELLVQKRPLTCKYPGCVTCEYEFACLCSHIKAMREGIKSGDDYFVILEDDIQLKIISNSLKFISKNYYPPRAKKVLNLISRIKSENKLKSTLGGCLILRNEKNLFITKEL